MKKRVAYYVSRKNPLIWLAALVMLASAALRIANVCGKGADAKTVWFLVVLPVVGCVFYVLNILCNGSDRFYRSSVPVILLAIYYGIKITLVSPYLWLTFMFWIAYLAIAAFYAVTVSGHIKSTIPLLLLLIAALGILVGMHEKEFTRENWPQLRQILPDMLFLLAGILTLLGAKVYLDGAYHPTWGDRPDGRRLRTLDPMAVVANYIMPTRIGSSNFIRESVDIGPMERYIREKRKQGYTNLGVTHVFLAAYVQCVAKYPALNRFLSGQQVYSRDDDIQFCMVVKTSMDTSAPESITKLHLKPTDTIDDIYEKLNKGIASIQGQAIGGSDFDKTAKFLSFIPGVLFKFVVWLLRTIDYFGFLPKFLLEVSGKKGKMLVCQDRECGYRETVSRTTNARCPKCHKRMEMLLKGKEETFVCQCGYKEKLSSFQARRAKEGAGVNKRDVQRYLKKQQKEANEPVNNAFAQALSGIKLD